MMVSGKKGAIRRKIFLYEKICTVFSLYSLLVKCTPNYDLQYKHCQGSIEVFCHLHCADCETHISN